VPESGQLRELPGVHEVLERLGPALERFPRAVVLAEVRRVIEAARAGIRAGSLAAGNGVSIETLVERSLESLMRPSLRRVINATGVVLHTNLGRAPLGKFEPISGYSNLEYDVHTGKRGKRDVHAGGLLERLVGASAIAVNNNAAAIFLALHELAHGHEVIVSRGELIEIGDGFRIPDIMHSSGAVLCEVGTTNRTHIDDFRSAINERTRLLLRIHPSNFRMEGFTARPELRELAALGRESVIPVYEDLGSGCMTDLRVFGIKEPLVSASLEAGADVVSFSGDKLLGGPQAGIIAGKPELIARLRRNPMFRALRLDKLIYQALETTLRHVLLEEWDCVPALAMIRANAAEIRQRAEGVASLIAGVDVRIEPGQSVIGGGSTPEQSIPTWLLVVEVGDVRAAERRLRLGEPAVIARIEDDRLVIDLRTVFPEEENALVSALRSIADAS
jgi:L-seryl-tRNA(Ser) seleniumtransferase